MESFSEPVPQRVRWNSGVARISVGMKTEDVHGGGFIPWEDLKTELEEQVLIQLGRVLRSRTYTVETADFHGRPNWLIQIVDESKKAVGSIWLGGDPYQNWLWDGLVRAGNAPDEHTAKVWQVFQRYSDGSYRRIKALDTPDDRIAS